MWGCATFGFGCEILRVSLGFLVLRLWVLLVGCRFSCGFGVAVILGSFGLGDGFDLDVIASFR